MLGDRSAVESDGRWCGETGVQLGVTEGGVGDRSAVGSDGSTEGG